MGTTRELTDLLRGATDPESAATACEPGWSPTEARRRSRHSAICAPRWIRLQQYLGSSLSREKPQSFSLPSRDQAS
jgi:hypothetical protein